MEYLIEAMDAQGRWYIRGSDITSGHAQRHMREMQRREDDTAFRVVESGGADSQHRRLIVCHDPNGKPFAAA